MHGNIAFCRAVMGGGQSRMNELALRDARQGVDSLGRAVEDLSQHTARGLRLAHSRIDDAETYVQQMEQATGRGFQ